MSKKNKTKDQPLPEEAFDRFISVLDGPVNRQLEKLMSSKLFLLPLGLSMTMWSKSIAMVRKQIEGGER